MIAYLLSTERDLWDELSTPQLKGWLIPGECDWLKLDRQLIVLTGFTENDDFGPQTAYLALGAKPVGARQCQHNAP